MQIILSLPERIALYALPDLPEVHLDTDCVRVGPIDEPVRVILDLDASSAVVERVMSLPTSWTAGQWQLDAGGQWLDLGPSRHATELAAAKAQKNSEINAARLAANQSTFAHAGKLIACDPLSRSDIDGVNGFVALTGALPPGWPGAWKAADNSLLSIPDVAAWTAFYGAMVAAGNANFGKAQALKAALEAASTVAEVAAVVW